MLTSDTRLVLTNAVYFQGAWAETFATETTGDAPFYGALNETLNVPTMYQRETFAYVEDGDVQVRSLPYRDHSLSMVVILPKARDGLAALEAQLTDERFAW